MKKYLILTYALIFYQMIIFPQMDSGYPACALYLEGKGGIGTGFFVSDSAFLYLVTAGHVLSNINYYSDTLLILSYPRNPSETKADTIKVILSTFKKENRILYHNNYDVVLLPFGKNVKVTFSGVTYFDGVYRYGNISSINHFPIKEFKKFSEINIADECYLFGYPVSVGDPRDPQFIYSRPLVRKGIIAGKNLIKNTLIIDCPVFQGNSGGPVSVVQGLNLYLVGLTIQFIPFLDEWENRKFKGLYNTEVENSGLGVVIPVDYILELIENFNTRVIR